MKAVAILRHAPSEGAAYFATYLEQRSLPSRLIAIDAGEAVPRDARPFAGLVLMGGPMSANDPLPWIAPVLELIRSAVRNGVPVLGHCLGGQLMARAFGGEVRRNPVVEIGWGTVQVADNALARAWFDGQRSFEAFHWHGETFSLPPGATRVLTGAHCANQAFVLGKHLGMQCHVEMTAELVRSWCREGRHEIESGMASPAVQPVAEIERGLAERVAALNRVAERLYDRWIAGLA